MKILGYVFAEYTKQGQSPSQSLTDLRQNLLLVCKTLKVRRNPLFGTSRACAE